jgi:hypothetical protein
MNLPTSIRNVQYYKIAGKYSYEGELIITDGVLYFFPTVDLEEQRLRKNMFLGGGCIVGIIGFITGVVILIILKLLGSIVSPLIKSSYSDFRKTGLWKDTDTSETLQPKLDNYIAERKQNKELLSSSMPAPIRFSYRDIHQGLIVNGMGELRFYAYSDWHDFNVGVVKKELLRRALKEGKFLMQ